MTADATRDIEETELHGYLDGELNQDRVDDVEAFLDQEKKAAERLVHYGMQGDLIRRLYSPLINRPTPYGLAGRLQQLSQLPSGEPSRGKGRATRILVTLLLTALVLGAAFWFLEPMITNALANLIPG